jgi:MFS family permease
MKTVPSPPHDARGVSIDAAVDTGRETRSVLVTVGIGEILVQLGLTPIVAVIPGLAAALGVSAADGAWVLTAFILALAGTLLVCGRLGDLIGHRTMFAWGAVVYALASALAGLLPSFPLLLAARTLQGVGAAMISGNNLAILMRAMPAAKRGRAIAVVAMTSSLAAVLGAGLGTAAIAFGGWPLLFLGPVPIALWAAIRGRRLPDPPEHRSHVRVDWAGAGLLALTAALVAIALNHPHGTTSDVVMPLFHVAIPGLALIAAAIFVLVERRVETPLIDWTQLRSRGFAAAIGVNTVLHVTMMATLFLGPVLIVRGLNQSDTAGGMLMVAVQTSVVGTAYLGGWLYDRTRSSWIRPGAAAILAIGFVAWALSGVAGSYPALIAFGLFAGLGSGVLLAVNNLMVMTSLPDAYRGVASGMLETTRHFGHAFGVTIPTAIVGFVAASMGVGGEATALRWGFFWSCLSMAVIAFLGIVLALASPRQSSSPT